jgi:uncharacterized membrane protein YqjE
VRPLVISAITFMLVFGGAFCAMYFRKIIAADHLREDVKDVVRLNTGIIGTIAALVLGLLIASAKNSYDALRIGIPIMVDRITNEGRSGKSAPFETIPEAQHFVSKIQELKPATEAQHALQTRIVDAAVQLAQTRLALFTQSNESIPVPFLTILIFWLTVIFASFGLFVRPVPIVVGTFAVGALSVSGALFLILEMDQPFAGIFQISTDTLSNALAPLGN